MFVGFFSDTVQKDIIELMTSYFGEKNIFRENQILVIALSESC